MTDKDEMVAGQVSLVERLRFLANGFGGSGYDELNAGADEIERLSARIKVLEEAGSELLSGHDNLYVAHWGPNSDPTIDIAAKAMRTALLQKQQEEGDGA